MADPLSITTGVVALLTSAFHVGLRLKDFYDGAAMANTKIKSLMTNVENYTRVLQMMRDTFEQEHIRANFTATGHIGALWSNLSATIKDGQTTLAQLETTLIEANKTVGFLDGARKHIRLKGAADKILVYQQQIRSHSDTLQLTLQAITIWNHATVQESTTLILPGLDEINTTIRCLALSLNSRILDLESQGQSDPSSPTNSGLRSLTNLRNTVQSAASVVSSASVIMGFDLSSDYEPKYESEFGDCNQTKPNEAMSRWLSSNTVYDFIGDQAARTHARNRLGGIDEAPDDNFAGSDSDSEFEVELFEALVKQGNDKLAAKDGREAESVFRRCLAKIPWSNAEVRHSMRLRVLDCLVSACIQQKKLEDAKSILLEKISLHPRNTSSGKSGALLDTLAVVDVLTVQKSYPEAMLYGRRALKGYRRIDSPIGEAGVEMALELLIKICHEAGNVDEEHAFSAILKDLKNKQSQSGLAIPTDNMLPSVSKLSLNGHRPGGQDSNQQRTSK